MTRYLLPVLLLAALVTVACESTPASTLVNVPDPVTDAPATHVIQLAPDRPAAPLRAPREIGSVLLGTGPDRAEPSDIAIAPDGDMLVSDTRVNQIFAVAPDGTAHPMVAADVPREFQPQRPHSIVPFSDGTVAVGDRTGMIKVYEKQGHQLKPLRVIKAPRVDDACRTAGAMAVRSGFDETSLIRLYDARGGLLRSFGKPFAHASAMVRRAMSGGLLGCLRQGQVIAVSDTLPNVEAFASDGTRLWKTQLQGLHLRQVTTGMGDRGEFVQLEGAQTYDVPAAVNSLDADRILVQFARVTRPRVTNPDADRDKSAIPTKEIEIQIHSLLLSATTGDGRYLGTSLPLVLETTDTRLYATTLNKSGPVRITTYEIDR